MKMLPRLKGLIPVFALASLLAFSANASATVTSVASGAWNNPATWDTGVPVSTDDVVIGAGTAVSLNVTPVTINSLRVDGTLEYDATARALTVTTNLAISVGGALQTNTTGAQTGHNLTVGGNLTNDGTLDLSTSANTSGARLTFTGAASNTFSGSGLTTDLRTLTINKGTSQANVLEITTSALSVQGTVVDGTPMAFLTITNGTLKMSGTFTFAGRTFTSGSFSIPANGGFWLNNPNYTVSGASGSSTVNGLFRISQGTFNIGTANSNSMGFGNNAVVTVEGGAINAAGRFGVNAPLNNLTYTQTGGVITVCTIGNTSTTLASFDLGQGVGPDVVMSGGSVIFRLNCTGVPAHDYRNQQGTTPLGITNTLLQFGDAGSGAAKTFNVEGLLPNVLVSNASAGHTVLFRSPTYFNNSARNVTINAGCTFNIGNQAYLQSGSTFTNDGTLTANGPSSRFVAFQAGGSCSYQGGGSNTGAVTSFETQTANLTMSQQVVARRIILFGGNIFNASMLTLGDGSATLNQVQIGNTTTPTAAGTFDVAPTFNLGTGGEHVSYLRTTAPRSTGVEINPGRALVNLTYDDNDPSHMLTIAGGDLAVSGTTALTNGRVVTGASTLSANGAVTRTNGYVDGLLQKPVPVGAPVARTFEVGDAVAYSPVDVTFPSVTGPGTLVAQAHGGDHAQIASSGIDASKSVNRHWTVTNSGTAFATADAVFHFAPGDIDAGANFNDFVVRKYDAPNWSATTTGTRTATSTQATGITSFSDFAVGDLVTYAIDASAGSGGSISPSGSVAVPVGDDKSFTITPNAGYSIADVAVDGNSVGAVATYTFSNVTATHTIHATFSVNTYTVTATAGPNGAISPSGAVSVSGTSDQAFTITPDPNYHIVDVLVDGSSVGAVGTYTLTNVVANHTIHATFAINTHTITATAGPNGAIAPSGAVIVNHGADQAFTITPDANYHIVDVLVDGGSVGAVASYTLTNVTTDHTIHATFAIDTHTVTATAGPNGAIAPSGAVSVNHGADQAFTITPDANYHVADVLLDGNSVGAVTAYTLTNVTTDHTIHASFAIDTYTITATAGAGGTIAPSGAVTVNHGADQAFAITADANHGIGGVVVDSNPVGAVGSYTFNNVTTNHTIHAKFYVSNISLNLEPSNFNLNSHGNWVTAILEPGSPYSPGDIDVASLKLDGSVAVASGAPTSIGDADGDNIPDLTVKFPRAAVAALLSEGNAVTVTVSGKVGSECFTSTTVIKVKSKTLLAPTASLLPPSSEVDVQWETDNDYAQVDLIASYDNGQTWFIEARDIDNSGLYHWTTPAVYTTQAWVAVVKLTSSATAGDPVTVAEFGESGYEITTPTGVRPEDITFALRPIQPNPAKGAFNVSFSLPTNKPAKLAVYDVTGREVESHDIVGVGRHSVMFGAHERLHAGVYMVRITHENRSLKSRVVVIQ